MGPNGVFQGQNQDLLEPSLLKVQMEKLNLQDREQFARGTQWIIMG